MTGKALWRYIQYLKRNGLAARDYEVAFWSRFAAMLAVPFMCVLAVPFVLGPLRATGTGARMVVGIGIGLAWFLVSRALADGGAVWNLNPWRPPGCPPCCWPRRPFSWCRGPGDGHPGSQVPPAFGSRITRVPAIRSCQVSSSRSTHSHRSPSPPAATESRPPANRMSPVRRSIGSPDSRSTLRRQARMPKGLATPYPEAHEKCQRGGDQKPLVAKAAGRDGLATP